MGEWAAPCLGRFERVDLREVWSSEAGSFTPWLAQSENLALLVETLGLPEVELLRSESPIGPFRADLVCKVMDTDEYVLVENQIERSDHLHLGQVVTYAAGLDAAHVVWVCSRFTEEHRAAIDWLNTITTDRFNFFAVEIEAWRIGESLPAPKFNLVAKPNDWTRGLRTAARRADSDSDPKRTAYWT